MVRRCVRATVMIVALWESTALAQSPPLPQNEVFPSSDDAMARALADPFIALETKEELFRLFERRQWPQEIQDRAGNTWLYRPDQPPVMIRRR